MNWKENFAKECGGIDEDNCTGTSSCSCHYHNLENYIEKEIIEKIFDEIPDHCNKQVKERIKASWI